MESGLECLNRDEAAIVRERGAFGLLGAKLYGATGIWHSLDGKHACQTSWPKLDACLAGAGPAGF